jgi:hypothetical protein
MACSEGLDGSLSCDECMARLGIDLFDDEARD